MSRAFVKENDLEHVINEVRDINFVVYDVSGKPPVTIEEEYWIQKKEL